MPYRYELIAVPPSDPGSASALVDQQSQLNSLQSDYGVFGNGMTITSATIETAEPGMARVYLDEGVAFDGSDSGLFVESASGSTLMQIVGGGTPGMTVYDDAGNTSFVLQGGSGTIFYMNDPTFGITVWIVPQGGLGLLAGTDSGNTVSWHQNLLLPMDSFVQGYRRGSMNAWHAHVDIPGGGAGVDLTLFADGFGNSPVFELWAGPSTNTRVFWIGPSGAGYIISDFNVQGACLITGAMSAIGNSVCWNDLVVVGNCTVGSLVVSSDEALKRDVQPLPTGQTDLHKLQVFSYIHKYTERRLVGLIAQDVQAVIPQAVITTAPPELPKEGGEEPGEPGEPEITLGVDMYMIMSLLVVEVQQLHRRLTAMEER